MTTIQKLFGHQPLNSTIIYARIHDRTVAEDYYAAMEVVEKRLEASIARKMTPSHRKRKTTPIHR